MDNILYSKFYEVQQKHWWFKSKKIIVNELIKKFLNNRIIHDILDVGCGPGLMLKTLGQYGRVYGLDESELAVNFSNSLGCATVAVGSLTIKNPFDQKKFDLITALDVIEHIDDDLSALVSIKSMLSKEGFAVITVPAYQFLWSPFDDINHHRRRYTLEMLENKLNSAGFMIQKISYYNFFLFPLALLSKLFNRILNRSGVDDLELPPAIINWALGKIFQLEKNILKKARFPYGVSLIAIVK
jgi:SAM-dependent methyltransferase